MPTTPVTVTVAGFARRAFPPERCTVIVAFEADGSTADAAHEPVVATSNAVAEHVRRMHDATTGPVVHWSLDRLYTSMHRPWSDEGDRVPYVYTSRGQMVVEFGDLTAVDAFVHHVATDEVASAASIGWSLTDESYDDATAAVRDAAVRNAVDKAEAYANSVGLSTVRPVAIADPGMLGVVSHERPHDVSVVGARAFAAAPPDATVELKPEDIHLVAEVHARFDAS